MRPIDRSSGVVALGQPVEDRFELVVVEPVVDLADIGFQGIEALDQPVAVGLRADRRVVGETNDDLAPIVGIVIAIDESERFEPVDRPRDGPGRDPDVPRQLAGRERADPVEHVETLPVGGVDAGEWRRGTAVQRPERPGAPGLNHQLADQPCSFRRRAPGHGPP